MRYSPRPIESYGWSIDGTFQGPSKSILLRDDPDRWNLAFLSFDYDAYARPKDLLFVSLVTKTVATSLSDGGDDLAGRRPGPHVRDLLNKPAPQFVKLISESPFLDRLPLYRAYGKEWIRTMEERSWICEVETDETRETECCGVAHAYDVLTRFRARR